MRSSGAVSASRDSVPAAIGSPVRAAVAATRSTNAGSLPAAASLDSATSPACSTTPSSSGRRTGALRSADSPRFGNAERAARIPTSTAYAVVRAAPDSALARSKRSPSSSSPAISSASWARSTSRALPTSRMQLGAHVEQQQPGFGHLGARSIHQLRSRQRVKQVHVAQPAPAVLQVRLDPVRNVAVLGPPGVGSSRPASSNLVADAGPP